MRLKHLALQGYKSFASRTEFALDAGITAIVGPNGSGKSNIADAIRWVLGEQSLHTLRSKRTEDMIFSGSDRRARLGMAEVALTLDNSDGWLPTEFREVTIARRAYRSGENEYLLNGTRVRLKDITELLGRSGLASRTYTVIGQGLIDQALSLRPEERRSLIEEAAGIHIYQDKRAEALAKLAETEANRLRVLDIMAELEPRLRHLERQAQRAQEAALLQADLQAHQRIVYGYRWQRARVELEQARQAEAQAQEALAARQASLASLEERLTELRSYQNELRTRLGELHNRAASLHHQAEALQREIAVRAERERNLGAQREELLGELSRLRSRLESGEAEQQAALTALIELERKQKEIQAQVAQAEAALAARERERRAAYDALEAARARLAQIAANLTDIRNRVQQSAERRAELERERDTQRQALEAARQEAATHLATCARLEAEITRIGSAETTIEARRQDALRAADQATEELQRAIEARNEAQREIARLRERYELLTRLREEGAGYASGVRAVLAAGDPHVAAKSQSLHGILGTVGRLLEVPPRLERAIEAALGGHVQDVVVARWDDAEAAIDYLKRTGAGRATFLPLDSIRPPRPIHAPTGPGVLGLASELVRADDRFRPVIELLLNRTIVVQDLPTARRIFRQASDMGAVIVTRAGEQVRPGGSISGGSTPQGGGSSVLAREREWRELPEQIAEAERRARAAQEVVAAAERTLSQWRAQAANLETEIKRLSEARRARIAERDAAERARDRAHQTAEWREGLVANLTRELATLQSKLATLEAQKAHLEDESKAAEEAVREAEKVATTLGVEEQMRAVAEARAAASALDGQRASQAALVATLQTTQKRLTEEIANKEARAAQLLTAQEEERRALTEARAQANAIAGQIGQLETAIAPAESELSLTAAEQSRLEAQIAQERTSLHQEETIASQAQFARQRAQDQLTSLRREIEGELGLVELERNGLASDQPPLPFEELVQSLPVSPSLPEGIEAEIRRLRGQLQRLGAVNADAPKEYEAEKQRYEFLRSQMADLERADASLRAAVAELDQVMQREFRRTFQAVAAAFQENFKALFGGGTARLELTAPDDIVNTGIEIIARPPGKRTQSLALLSGGERALTAAALIFSILQVSPTPFCVLDEVDAMLDEVNVGRFREMLQRLTQRTQFIVITHNRGTIEAANTIYGVSMGPDSTSQVISLRLDGHGLMPPDNETEKIQQHVA
jgi:chromosome segregation protein